MATETDIPLKELQAIAAFPIERAWVCVDCKTVCNIAKCPYCLSENVNPLGNWLNHPVTKLMREAGVPQCGVALTSDHEPRLSTYCMRPRGHKGEHNIEKLYEDMTKEERLAQNFGPYDLSDPKAKRGF